MVRDPADFRPCTRGFRTLWPPREPVVQDALPALGNPRVVPADFLVGAEWDLNLWTFAMQHPLALTAPLLPVLQGFYCRRRAAGSRPGIGAETLIGQKGRQQLTSWPQDHVTPAANRDIERLAGFRSPGVRRIHERLGISRAAFSASASLALLQDWLRLFSHVRQGRGGPGLVRIVKSKVGGLLELGFDFQRPRHSRSGP